MDDKNTTPPDPTEVSNVSAFPRPTPVQIVERFAKTITSEVWMSLRLSPKNDFVVLPERTTVDGPDLYTFVVADNTAELVYAVRGRLVQGYLICAFATDITGQILDPT